MSRGPGWIEREIYKVLIKDGDRPVSYLSHHCHLIKKKMNKDINLYSSVCRTVRRLEKKGILESHIVGLKEIKMCRYSLLGEQPTYKKFVGFKE